MSPDHRRDAIIQAALPLVSEQGAAVATRRIAEAAGIAEGTIFRVFATKEELLHACVSEAFRLDHVQTDLQRIGADDQTEAKLEQVATLIGEHFTRLGTLMRALATTGHDPRTTGHATDAEPHDGPCQYVRGLAELITDLLETDRDRFTVPTGEIAHLLLGMILSLRFDPRAQEDLPASIATRIRVLLHGALR
ncbi:TetR/AcrR family transcriptional regulator [Parasphingorhabdus pacifica]